MPDIEKRGENSYRLTVSCGHDNTGKQIRKRKTINLAHIKPEKQMDEATKQLHLFQAEVERGTFLDGGKLSFGEFIDRWLADYAEPTLAPKTLYEYKGNIRRIKTALGHIKLNKLQPNHLVGFYNNLREDGIRLDKTYAPKEGFADELLGSRGLTIDDLKDRAGVSAQTIAKLKLGETVSQATAAKICKALNLQEQTLFDIAGKPGGLSERSILHHHRLISSILTCAVQWQLILISPAARVKAPKVDRKEAKHFSIEQTEYILELLEDEPLKYRTMLTLAIYGGMRLGELAALQWSDIDTEKGTLKINKALQYIPGEETFVKNTKNKSSDRPVSLPGSVIALLREYKLWQNAKKAQMGNLWHEEGFLFTTFDGRRIYPGTISKWSLNFLRRHNEAVMNDETIPEDKKEAYLLPENNFHSMRHTSASILINQGVDTITVSKRLGHARTSTTTDIYAHLLKDSDQAAADKLENVLTKKKKGKEREAE